MAIVNKRHFSKDSKGISLRKLMLMHKDKTEYYARIRARKSPHRYEAYITELPFFESGNDGILEYIPNGDPKNSIIYIANSAVNDVSSPFANMGRGKYVLIPHKKSQMFEYIITNREREMGKGHRRNRDTEFKLLEKLATLINTSDVGHINLYTFYEPCLSCDYVIIQFIRKYPKISINVYFEEKY